MTITDYTMRILEPSSGLVLTQSNDVDILERILTDKLYLGVNDSPDNWKEITNTEADEIRQKQEELAKELEEKELEVNE